MKPTLGTFKILTRALLLALMPAAWSLAQQPEVVSMQFDGSKRLNQVDGFGVNANTRSWNEKELVPALDLLLDSVHATIWRLIV
jgi:hypothetical protein